jgi:hypothetical protein
MHLPAATIRTQIMLPLRFESKNRSVTVAPGGAAHSA